MYYYCRKDHLFYHTMIPKLDSGRTGHHSANRGLGRGMSGGRWGRELRNGYAIKHNPIRRIRTWNRSHEKIWLENDEINLQTIHDSPSFLKYNYPAMACRCCWRNCATL
jgi:hypothetical protein